MVVSSIIQDVGGVHVYMDAVDETDVALMAHSGKVEAMRAAQQAGHQVNAPTNIRGPFHVDKTDNRILGSQEEITACKEAGNLVYRMSYSFTFAGA
jgi:hypothetical protein